MWVTYIAKVLIKQFNISMQHFQSQQLIVLVLQTTAEIQTGIPVYTIANHDLLDSVTILSFILGAPSK